MLRVAHGLRAFRADSSSGPEQKVEVENSDDPGTYRARRKQLRPLRRSSAPPLRPVNTRASSNASEQEQLRWSDKPPNTAVFLAVAAIGMAAASYGYGAWTKKLPPGKATIISSVAHDSNSRRKRPLSELTTSTKDFGEEHAKIIGSWRNRWVEGRIGFHINTVHPELMKHMSALLPAKSSSNERTPVVLVPLCGKSIDMLWLAVRGVKAVGVEVSGEAIEQLFEETRMPRTTSSIVAKKGSLTQSLALSRLHSCGNLAVIEGDFFVLSDVADAARRMDMPQVDKAQAEDAFEWWESAVGQTDLTEAKAASQRVLGPLSPNRPGKRQGSSKPTLVDAIWDRAAMVAIDPSLRATYARTLSGLLRPGGRMLLVTLVYDSSKGRGPPYSLPVEEVRELFEANDMSLKILSSVEAAERAPSLVAQGVTAVKEVVCLLEKKGG